MGARAKLTPPHHRRLDLVSAVTNVTFTDYVQSPVRGRFTKSVASETAKQGPTKVPVSLHWAGRIGLLDFTPIVKFAGASFVLLLPWFRASKIYVNRGGIYALSPVTGHWP